LLPLAVMGAAIAFSDVVRAAAGAPEIVAFINSEIAGAGLALVARRAPQAPRNGPGR
jgi:hypothetical protein